MIKHIMFLHVWKAIDHTIILALSYFPYIFWCQLMHIFLTQFWTEKLLIYKPQPRPISSAGCNHFVFLTTQKLRSEGHPMLNGVSKKM